MVKNIKKQDDEDNTINSSKKIPDLSLMERVIVWSLFNSEMKLSYEDLGALLGKNKATISKQIKSINQKNSGIIEESIEPSGTKRIYMSDKMKEAFSDYLKNKKNDKK